MYIRKNAPWGLLTITSPCLCYFIEVDGCHFPSPKVLPHPTHQSRGWDYIWARMFAPEQLKKTTAEVERLHVRSCPWIPVQNWAAATHQPLQNICSVSAWKTAKNIKAYICILLVQKHACDRKDLHHSVKKAKENNSWAKHLTSYVMELVTGLGSPLSKPALPVGNTHYRCVLLCMNIKQIRAGKEPAHFTAPGSIRIPNNTPQTQTATGLLSGAWCYVRLSVLTWN